MNKTSELLKRYPKNPIITPEDFTYPVNSVFNTGAALCGEETLLLMRVEDRRGISHFTVARSKDGLNGWKIDSQPTFMPDPGNYPEELWGIEDPRITFLEGCGEWTIVYTAYSGNGPLVSIAQTDDFKVFRRLGAAMLPSDKDAALFPVQFGGRWAMIHRPIPAADPVVQAHIWLSFSPDLKHWGEHRILFKSRSGAWWDSHKIGLATPPLQTSEGWLIIYHGVKQMVSGDMYRLGLALLDLGDPTKVIRRSEEWIFDPREPYERVGDVDNVIFPCGFTQKGDTLNLYYGAADSYIAVATGSISEMLSWLQKNGG
jgi:predicted GH43/DUF377 family glycosyl hydrolase